VSEPDDRFTNPPAPLASHVDEMTCLLYVERQLDRPRGQHVAAHIEDCTACSTLLRAIERESRLLTRAMLEEDEALPARLAVFQERARRSMQWIWGVVFGLAASGLYALYTAYIEPWQQRLEQAGFGGTNLLNLLIFQGAFWKGWQTMLSLIEVLALVTLAGIIIAFLRRRLRGGSALALVVAGLCAALAVPAPASAIETRKGDVVEIRKDEKIVGNAYLTGNRVRVDGTVDGDVFIFSKEADVSGHVTGDVFAFAQSFRVSGQVDGSVRAFDNNVTVTGSVNHNVLDFCETLRLDPNSKVGGSLTSFAETSSVDGSLGRDILGFGETMNIAGKIGGEVRYKGDTLVIGSGTIIGGSTRFEGNKPPTVSSDAKLGSPVQFSKIEHKPRYLESGYYFWQTIWAAAFILFGMILVLVLPAFSRQATHNAERIGASCGLGVLVGFGVPIAALIACCTIVGLFVGISAFFLWYASLYFAQVIVGALIGQWLIGRTDELWPMIGRMIVGVVLVRLVFIVPHVGIWLKIGVVIWGIGALALTIYQRFQPVVASGSTYPAPVPSPLPPNTTVGGMQPA
jgi:cytoskeletal protein CcmA (bactofilin family)